MRNRLTAVLGLLFVALMIFAAPGIAANDNSPGEPANGAALTGVLKAPDKQPIANARVSVTNEDGEAVGETVSDQDGRWLIPVPGAGKYNVELDLTTIPDGIQPRREGGEVIHEIQVRGDKDQKGAIFSLIGADEEQLPAEEKTTFSTDGQRSSTKLPITASRVAQHAADGLKFGAIIAITAIGLSLVFGTTGLINFAHGELVTIGAVMAYWFSTSPGSLPLVVAALLAVVIGSLLAAGMELGLWRPMRKRNSGRIQLFIISIGVSLLLRHIILIYYGSTRRQYIDYSGQRNLTIGPITIGPAELVVVTLSVLVLFGVGLMLQTTRIGKAMRAVADNQDLAESSGINVNRVILVVWIIGGGLAALGGVFYGIMTTAVYWNMGFNLLLLMFAGVILGGLGSAYGAIAGSFVVGLVYELSSLWFPIDLQNAWALLALILVLLVRPQGILGRAERAG